MEVCRGGGWREFRGGSWGTGQGGEGVTEVSCDDPGIVAREDNAGCYMNTRVSVEDVRFKIIKYI